MSAPTESKVYSATIGGGVGATVGSFTVWLLGVTVWGAAATADNATAAIGAVPAPAAGMVFLLITVGGTFAGGWVAKHTPRPQSDDDDMSYAELKQRMKGGQRVNSDPGPKPVLLTDADLVPHADHLEPPANPRDLNGDGHDDKTGRWV